MKATSLGMACNHTSCTVPTALGLWSVSGHNKSQVKKFKILKTWRVVCLATFTFIHLYFSQNHQFNLDIPIIWGTTSNFRPRSSANIFSRNVGHTRKISYLGKQHYCCTTKELCTKTIFPNIVWTTIWPRKHWSWKLFCL